MNIRLYMYTVLITLIIATCILTSCEKIQTQVITATSVEKVAIAVISEIAESGLTGTATFREVDAGVHVVIQLQNAVHGNHAMHIHTGSDCALDWGPHWHPTSIPPGVNSVPVVYATPDKPPIGVGEIGNIFVAKDGTGTLEFTTPFWSLGGSANTDILGKLILIHETGDTFISKSHDPHAAHMAADTDKHMPEEVSHGPPYEPYHVQSGGGGKIGCGVITLVE